MRLSMQKNTKIIKYFYKMKFANLSTKDKLRLIESLSKSKLRDIYQTETNETIKSKIIEYLGLNVFI